MVTLEELEARRALAAEGDLARLLERLTAKAEDLLERTIVIPRIKAQLSADGGTCPACQAPLAFDPWSPTEHHCPRCHQIATGPRHDAHWARAQHLWVAERAAHLAAVAVWQDDEQFALAARKLLRGYHQLYFELPNRDNVLGPSHLFFSTYLESIWILSYVAAAHLLRERGWLPEEEIEAVNAILDEAATLIGDFNEGLSNRQTWNAAALTAIAVWFGDEELGQAAIESRTGLLGHLTDGFDDDGMWVEGENYHLFALRGLLLGIDWARLGGVDLLDDPLLARHLGQAVMAPSLTALPDLTFPARKDSRFGVSLAHPAYLECFEQGLARLGESAPPELAAWIGQLYQRPATAAQTYDAYLHDAGGEDRDRTDRADLSWWMLFGMVPELPDSDGEPIEAPSALLRSQGTAILRQHHRYLALECGNYGGDHGHPDRLALTLHADGVHWLADPGTGSYVTRDLFWYRSTLAHNAPRLDGVSQEPGEARCLAFDDQGDWGWIAADYRGLRRTVVQGPRWILDLVEVQDGGSHRLELPWHLDGDVTVETAGRWEPDALDDDQVSAVERFTPEAPVDVVLRADRAGGTIRLHLVGGTLLRATAPGRPGSGPRVFHLVRSDGVRQRLAAVLDWGTVDRIEVEAGQTTITEASGATSVRIGPMDATIGVGGKTISLGGPIISRPPARKLVAEQPIRSEGEALRIDHPPALDGSLEGFDGSAPLHLEDEGHYYRSEEPYQGPEVFSARGFVNWDHHRLYLAVEVAKPDVALAPEQLAPRRLDNEPDDIHVDGVQVYYRVSGGSDHGYLIRPLEGGGVRVRPIPGSPADSIQADGGSVVGEDGYRITVALPCPEFEQVSERAVLSFDLVVNQAEPGRVRRAGQLAWGGGNGWVYLRGDRRAESAWGVLQLIA